MLTINVILEGRIIRCGRKQIKSSADFICFLPHLCDIDEDDERGSV